MIALLAILFLPTFLLLIALRYASRRFAVFWLCANGLMVALVAICTLFSFGMGMLDRYVAGNTLVVLLIYVSPMMLAGTEFTFALGKFRKKEYLYSARISLCFICAILLVPIYLLWNQHADKFSRDKTAAMQQP